MKKVVYFLAIIFWFILTTNQASAQSQPDKQVITVSNLTCDGDMPTIKKQLLSQDGIESVTFTKRTNGNSAFTIVYSREIITLDQIHKTIETTPGCDDKSTTPYRVKKDKIAKAKKS